MNDVSKPTEPNGAGESADKVPPRIAFGVDVGGSGIKGALVDLETGRLAGDRFKILTPKPATPAAIVNVIGELIDHFQLGPDVPVGVAFPATILSGRVEFVPNLHQSWLGVELAAAIYEGTSRPAVVVNDADAAGYAEAIYGAAKGFPGTVAVFTLGTGIGSALITHGVLWPNTELGHIMINGRAAETWAAASVREKQDLSYRKWARRLQRYFTEFDKLLHPDLLVVGGGVSRNHQKFLPLLDLRPPIIPAMLRNAAGIVGAAALAAR
jgi:polyphosphate glucokinase